MPDWNPPPYLRNRAPRPQQEPYAPRPMIDVTPPKESDPPLAPLVPPRLMLDQIQFQRYSSIIPWKVVEYKITPNALTPTSNVPMDWEFDEPEDDEDNELRLYVSLSPEDVSIIKRHGYHHRPIEKSVKVFGPADLAALEELQIQELEYSASSAARAFLRIEHKQQLEWAREQQYDLTILDYLASPFRRMFENRYQVTLGQRDLNSKLSEFKSVVSKHYAE
jgi:hypothetical protein